MEEALYKEIFDVLDQEVERAQEAYDNGNDLIEDPIFTGHWYALKRFMQDENVERGTVGAQTILDNWFDI